MIRATQIKGASLRGLLGCCLVLLAGSACTKDNPFSNARVVLADHGVGLLTLSKTGGESCYELRSDALQGSRGELSQYSCIKPQDKLGTAFLVTNNQFAAGGAVTPSVTTVSVNGQPAYLKGGYFLAVLPTVPGSDIEVTAADNNGQTVAQQHYPHDLVVSGQIIPTAPKS